MARLTTIGFDADDTLWHHERFFRITGERFATLLAPHTDTATLPARLLEAEKRNIALYGYGVKGFMLSMIETAVAVTDGSLPASVIGDILAAGREMLDHPIETLPHVRETLQALAGQYRLVVITKGDLFDQERKVAQSGLGELFEAVEIVSEKTPEVYARVFSRHGAGPGLAMMAGNSLKSDVLPALGAGCHGVYVPHTLSWALDHAEEPEPHPRFHRIAHLGELPALLAMIEAGAA